MNRAFMILSVMALGATVLPNDAYAKIALAQVRIKVVDQDGIVVPDAKIWWIAEGLEPVNLSQ